MPGIADMLTQQVLQDSNQAPDISGDLVKGAQLAQTMQSIQTQRAQIDQQKQQLQFMKLSKYGDLLETASKLDPGPRNMLMKNYLPNFKQALGIGDLIPEPSQKAMESSPELASYLTSQIQNGKLSYSDLISHSQDASWLYQQIPSAQAFMAAKNLGPAELAQTVTDFGKDLDAGEKFRLQQETQRQKNSVFEDRVTNTVHTNAINGIQKNQQVNDLLKGFQNLDNSINNFQNGGATPNEFNELQQAVRSNLGIKGNNSTGHERADSYARSAGIDAEKFWQYLTGNPQNINDIDPEIANQVVQIARMEQANKKTQAQKAIGALSKRYGSFYAQHPDLKTDYDAYSQSVLDQFQPSSGQGGAPQGGGNQAQSTPTTTNPAWENVVNSNKARLLQFKGADLEKAIQGIAQKYGVDPKDIRKALAE